jgi:hypothetical protein
VDSFAACSRSAEHLDSSPSVKMVWLLAYWHTAWLCSSSLCMRHAVLLEFGVDPTRMVREEASMLTPQSRTTDAST